jgi:hypothetical protein
VGVSVLGSFIRRDGLCALFKNTRRNEQRDHAK